jgi:hypothetical protein
MCYQEEKTVDHLFTECEIIKEIRIYIHDEIQRYLPSSEKYRRGDISIIMELGEIIQWRRLQLVTCFII